MDLSKLTVTPAARDEEPRFRALMDEHHHLGAPSKIGQTVWHAADDGTGEWPALAAFSAAAPSAARATRGSDGAGGSGSGGRT